MANVVRLGPEYVPQSSIGRPVANANIYVGIPDTDPEIVGNQKTLSVQQEDGTTATVAQPISTGAGGVPMYDGGPVTLLVDGNYSLKILSSSGVQIYYVPNRTWDEAHKPGNYYYPDYLAVDQGLTGNSNTIKYYVDTIGLVNKATIYLRHNSGEANTDYTFSTNETIPSNITLKREPGARLVIASGITVEINGGFDSGLDQAFVFTGTGTGVVSFGKGAVDKQYVEWFGGVGDDSTDNTKAFEKAIGTHATAPPIIQLLDGTYCFTGAATYGGIYGGGKTVKIHGSGRFNTYLKNTHVSGVGIRFAGTQAELKHLTLDNGGSTGIALEVDGQLSIIEDIQIINQGGTAFALYANACTLSLFSNINIGDTNAGGAYFLSLNGSTISNLVIGTISSTSSLKINLCTGLSFIDTVIDDPGPGLMIELIASHSIAFYNFYTEITTSFTGGVAIDIGACFSINFYGGYFYQDDTDSIVFNISGIAQGVILDGIEWKRGGAGHTDEFLRVSAAVKNLAVSNISTNLSAASTGINMIAAATSVKISNWNDNAGAASHIIDAVDLLIENVPGAIALTDRSNQTLINCSGAVTGTGALTHTRIREPEEIITAAGAASPRGGVTKLDSTAGAMAVTLADGGFTGAIKTIYFIADNGDVTFTVANHETSSPEVFTFDTAGDSLVLLWTSAVWVTLNNHGVAVP